MHSRIHKEQCKIIINKKLYLNNIGNVEQMLNLITTCHPAIPGVESDFHTVNCNEWTWQKFSFKQSDTMQVTRHSLGTEQGNSAETKPAV